MLYCIVRIHTNGKTIDFKINLIPDEPVYTQIADHVRGQVALRKLRAGDRLPPIRELARLLQVDPGTVARAYLELGRDGTVISRRGGGSFVSAGGTGGGHAAEQRRSRLSLVAERAVLEAMGLGFTVEEIETAFTLRLAEWRERATSPVMKKAKASGRRGAEIRFAGSHDLAVELLASHLASTHPDVHLTTRFVGSLSGLVALECRDADIAGSHLIDDDTGQFNIPFVRRVMPGEAVVVMNLMQRVQGLMVAPGNPKHIVGIEDLRRSDITFVNRQKGSGTRILLDSRMLRAHIPAAEIKGYQREETTHMAVATLVAQGQADTGLGAQSAASVAGLDFIPLLKERYDLIALQEDFERPALRKLQEVVQQESFKNMLRSIPGYDVSETGKIMTVGPKGETK